MADGYSISMDALAEAVPVSKRTLYNHFKDKKALFTAVVQMRCKSVFEALEDTLGQGLDVKDTLTQIGERFLAVVSDPDAIRCYRVMLSEAGQFPELGKLFYETGPKRSSALLSEYFRKLHTQRQYHIPEPELAADIFLGMLANRLQMKCLLGLKKTVSAKERSTIVRYAVHMFTLSHHRS